MPSISQIRSQRKKRARHAIFTRWNSNNPSNSDIDLTETSDASSSTLMEHDTRNLGGIDSQSDLSGGPPMSILFQYQSILPRVKDELFRIHVLRSFNYFKGTLKFSRNQSPQHCSAIFLIGISTLESWLKLF